MNFSCRRGHTALLRFNRPGETTLWFHCRNMEKSLIGKLITLFSRSSINYMWLSFRIYISLYSVDPYNLLFLFYCKYKLKKNQSLIKLLASNECCSPGPMIQPSALYSLDSFTAPVTYFLLDPDTEMLDSAELRTHPTYMRWSALKNLWKYWGTIE